jgi:AbrB family looped-hinge helix DNA binding protein
MASSARITSKGQVSIAIAVRRALGLGPGDQLVFEVEPELSRAQVRKVADFIALAGSVPVPRESADADWGSIRSVTWAVQACRRELGRIGDGGA